MDWIRACVIFNIIYDDEMFAMIGMFLSFFYLHYCILMSVVLHFVILLSKFYVLAIICDYFFVAPLEKIMMIWYFFDIIISFLCCSYDHQYSFGNLVHRLVKCT